MSQPSSEQPLFGAWPGFLVALLLTIGAVWVQTGFQTERPTEVKAGLATPGAQDVDARLWQDPFAGVAEARRLAEEEARKSGAVRRHDVSWLAAQIANRPALRAGGTIDAGVAAARRLAEEEARKSGAVPPHDRSSLAAQIANCPALQNGGAIDFDVELGVDVEVGGDVDVEILAILVHGGPSVGAAELRRRDRYAALSGLMLEGLLPDDAEHVGYFLPDRAPPDYVPFEWFSPFDSPTGKEQAQKEQAQRSERRDLLLLWIDQEGLRQLPSAPPPPVAGRAATPTSPENPRAEAGVAPGRAKEGQASAEGVGRGTAGSEDRGEGPRLLARLSSLFGEILEKSRVDPQRVHFSVIGPRNSQGLREIAYESHSASRADPKCRVASEAEMWSPFATMPRDWIEHADQLQAGAQGVCACDGADSCVKVLPPRPDQRTIADDRVLVKLLVAELGRRRIGPDSRIALVGQWDTAYSRALADEFKDVWYDTHALADKPDKPDERRILRSSYMRGLDGIVPGGKPRNSDKGSGGEPPKAVERAEGDAQLDYLRRMRDALVAKDAELRAACTPTQRFEQDCGIRAVGVFGNDYFDKLLVLKALKPVFPNAVFFTTDLDADMLNPEDNLVTRNLIVASGFGLTLRGRLQREIPPLRDSYQTSLLLAVRLALEPGEARRWEIPPRARLFEVGRTAPVELVGPHQRDEGGFLRPASPCYPGTPSDCDVHPPKELNAHFGFLVEGAKRVVPAALGAALILGGLLLVLTLGPDDVGRTLRYWWRGLSRGPLPVLVLASSLAVCILLPALAWMDIKGGGEPLSWIQGVSVWPTELLRLLAGFAALLFLVLGHDRLCKARTQIERDFGLESLPTPGETPLTGGRSQAQLTDLSEPVGPAPPKSSRVSAEPNGPAEPGPAEAPVAGSPGTAEAPPETRCGDLLSPPDAQQLGRRRVPVAQIWRCYMWGCRVLPRWLNGGAAWSDSPAECPKGWARQTLLARILPEVTLFFLLALSLMVVLGFPNRPVRSEISWWVDLAVILLVLIPFLGLLFYVVDATRHTLTLARDLAGRVSWSEASLRRFGLARWSRTSAADTGAAGDVDWLDVHLIARVSQPVGNLVWYPVLVLVILAFARHTAFDAWDFPPALMLVMLSTILYVVGCAWTLRLAAERVRKTALLNLSLARLRAQGTPGREVCIPQLDSLLTAVREEREGAFRPFSQQPVVQALLTLASSVSGLALIQYSSLLNL